MAVRRSERLCERVCARRVHLNVGSLALCAACRVANAYFLLETERTVHWTAVRDCPARLRVGRLDRMRAVCRQTSTYVRLTPLQ